jgi:hypothetical protein
MLTLDALDKLIFDGMTADSGEHFSDIAHHVRNAARKFYAALTGDVSLDLPHTRGSL